MALSNYGILIGQLTGNSLPLKPKRGIKCNVQLRRKVCGDLYVHVTMHHNKLLYNKTN
jgi:hypothetical protein